MKTDEDFDEYDLPEPGPVPEPERANPGMVLLTVANAVLAVLVVGNSLAPVIWYELLAGFEVSMQRYDMDPFQKEVRKPVASENPKVQELAEYQRWRVVFIVVAILSLLAMAGLVRTCLRTVMGDLFIIPTTGLLVLTILLLLINRLLGWGGWLAIAGIGLAALEAGLLQVPAVQQYLAETLTGDDDYDFDEE